MRALYSDGHAAEAMTSEDSGEMFKAEVQGGVWGLGFRVSGLGLGFRVEG